jgi:acetyl esterase/lipase
MASTQAKEFADFFGALSARSANPNFDLDTVRDVIETMHLATKEPEGVTYAEVDAGGVEALWCIPVDSDPDRVLLHGHLGGTVVASRHSDRKAAAHIAKAAGARALVLNFRRSPEHKFPAQIEDVRTAYNWLLQQGYRPENIASVGHSIGGNFAVGLALALRDEGAALPGAIVSISPWVDMTMTNETYTSNAERDRLLSRPLAEFFRSSWLDGTGVSFEDPRVNLLAADLSGLPPSSGAATSCSPARMRSSPVASRRPATTSWCAPSTGVSTPSSLAPAGCPKLTRRSPRSAPGCGSNWGAN